MSNPQDAAIFEEAMDPRAIRDWVVTLGRGTALGDILLPGEQVASLTVLPSATGLAGGLRIDVSSGRSIQLGGDMVYFWLSIDPAMRLDPIFDGAGIQLGIEVTITTDSVPPREDQITALVNVRQK